MILANLAGLMILAGLALLMLLLVPPERIRALLPFGLIFGVGLPFVVIGVMQNWLGYWTYRQVDPVTLAGIPVFLAVAWFPAVITFAHLLVQYRSPLLRLLLWLAIAAAVTLLQHALSVNNMLSLHDWTSTGTFILTLLIHAGLAAALHFMGHLDLRDLIKSYERR